MKFFINFFTIQRDNLIIRVISFFWILAKIMSIDAWLGGRKFPIIPLLDFLQNQPDILYYSHVFSLIFLTITLFKVDYRIILLIILSELLIICTDYIFLQPWECIYLVSFLLFLIYRKKPLSFINSIQYLLATVYILTGIHKLNREFLVIVWNKMILNNFLQVPQEIVLEYKLFFVGLLIPIIEILLGIGILLTNKKYIYYGLMVMHGLILVFIGPLGLHYNSIVWPWNLAMIFLLLLLSRKNDVFKSPNLLFYTTICIVILFISTIFGNISYYTFNLYAGKNKQVYIYSKVKFPDAYPAKKDGKYSWYINAQEWAMQEISLPPCPDNWYMKTLEDKLRNQFPEKTITISK